MRKRSNRAAASERMKLEMAMSAPVRVGLRTKLARFGGSPGYRPRAGLQTRAGARAVNGGRLRRRASTRLPFAFALSARSAAGPAIVRSGMAHHRHIVSSRNNQERLPFHW